MDQGPCSHHCCRHWLENACKIYGIAHGDLHADGNERVVQECNSLMVLAAVATQRLTNMDLKVTEATSGVSRISKRGVFGTHF